MKFLLALYMFIESSIAVGGLWTPRFGSTNTVVWEAKGFPGFLRINGEGGSVSGTAYIEYGRLTAQFRVNLRKFRTGLSLRDKHMHGKYLESEKFKYAGLVIDQVSALEGVHTFRGRLTIKDHTQPIVGKIEIVDKSKKLKHIRASFTVIIKQYPTIGIPEYAGVTMAEKVEVDVSFYLAEQ